MWLTFFIIYEVIAAIFGVSLVKNAPGFTTFAYVVTGQLWPILFIGAIYTMLTRGKGK